MTGSARIQLGGFLYLQLLDLMTTLAFLTMGIQEGNPMVRAAMSLTAHPAAGLVIVKVIAALLAAYCFLTNRIALLARMNVFFAVVIVWNVYVILTASARLLP